MTCPEGEIRGKQPVGGSMRIQFVGKITELLATFRAILTESPTMPAAEVTPRMMAEARLAIRRN